MAERKKLAIIDGKSVFYRGYYAMPNLSTREGVPTGGVYGFTSMALELIKKLAPDYVCVAWDKPKTNIRKRIEMYPEYKAGRKPAPPDFYTQIPILHELLEALGWPLYELDDYEADDIMGTLATQARQKDLETQLITSDLDALQLINGHVKVYALKRGFSNIEEFHPESFKAKYGLEPGQFLDLKALKGDASDNIPGVPGIGEKTAIQLLQDFKTLDSIYKNLDKVKDSVRKKLEAGKTSAYLSKKIGAIWCDAPIKLKLDEVDGRSIDVERLQDLLQKLEFRSLLRSLPSTMQPKPVSATKLKGLTPAAITPLESSKELSKLKGKKLYMSAEYGDPSRTRISQLAIAGEDGSGFILPGSDLSSSQLSQSINKLITERILIGADVKSILKCLGLPPTNSIFDVLIASFVLNPLVRSQSLADLVGEFLNIDLLVENFSTDERLGLEISALIHLESLFSTEFAKPENKKLKDLFYDIEMPVTLVLAQMELDGIKLDLAYMKKLYSEFSKTINQLEKKIYKQVGFEFNISSPVQLSEALFEKLQLPTVGIKRTQSSYSTAASELAKLKDSHPVIDFISQYREVTKLKNTYVDALPKQADKNSRLHTTFNLTVAATGRLSSENPNLQNIPVRTELGREIRRSFIAEPGNLLISADYSQFELRLAAALSGDENMIEAFNQDADIHTATAAQIYGIKPEDVTKAQRSSVKEVNFGVMYGLGPHGLAQSTGMTFAEARDFIAKYFEIRPKLRTYIDSLRHQASEQGYVETLLGRRRPSPDVRSSNFMVREAAYRAAVNMPMQGSAADIMKLAMVNLAKKLPASAKMLLQIHDSLIIEAPANQAQKIGKMVKETMETAYTELPVKLKADISIGKNWGEL